MQHDNLMCNSTGNVVIEIYNQDSINGVIRVCESSKQLGHSTHCEYVQSLSNSVIQANSKATISFRCPGRRSSDEPGGLFSILISSLSPLDPIPSVVVLTNNIHGNIIS